MTNIKALISYSGTHYFGFQQTKMGPSVEEVLERILSQILQHPIRIQAASRTDRGVHAKGQVINFFSDKANLSLFKLQQSLRRLLPSDIALLELETAPDAFHPTLDALGKQYHYDICNARAQLPFHREFSWHFYRPLDLEKMNQAASFLVGEHDFSAFSNQPYDDPIRTVSEINICSLPDNRYRIAIRGNRFMYKMVRNLVGTLAYVGCGKIPLQDISSILASKKRSHAGLAAPAHGLTLEKVFY